MLLHKIELIGKLLGKPAEKLAERPNRTGDPSSGTRPPTVETTLDPLVILGASTGGPQALAAVLSGLPATFATSIIIIQHVDAAFAPGLGQWLAEQAGRHVRLAAEGHHPSAGEILLSGTDDHLVVGEDHRLHYSVEPKESSYRPSVDVFFESAARNWPRPGVAVLLTGMLRDGAEGLLQPAPAEAGEPSLKMSLRASSGGCPKRLSRSALRRKSWLFPRSPRPS